MTGIQATPATSWAQAPSVYSWDRPTGSPPASKETNLVYIKQGHQIYAGCRSVELMMILCSWMFVIHNLFNVTYVFIVFIINYLPWMNNLDTFRLLLWDCDDRSYSYYIEASINNRDWELIVDKTREACQSWQTLTFPERAVVYFKIVGTFNTANEVTTCSCSCRCSVGVKWVVECSRCFNQS